MFPPLQHDARPVMTHTSANQHPLPSLPPSLCPLHLLCQSTGGFIQFVRVGTRMDQDASPSLFLPLSLYQVMLLRDSLACASGHYDT